VTAERIFERAMKYSLTLTVLVGLMLCFVLAITGRGKRRR
jgi:hypothetical protein